MYINATGYYIPTERVSNDHFFEINGLTSDWILQRTGIRDLRPEKEKIQIQWG